MQKIIGRLLVTLRHDRPSAKKIIIWLTTSFSLMMFTCLAQANIIYSVTFDGILNNTGLGVFGGDLNVGAGQALDLTVAYNYYEAPRTTSCSDYCFDLYGIQVFDNTNGLASDFFEGYGSLGIRYGSNGENDSFSTLGTGSPAGGGFRPSAEGEFGDGGDILPFGAEFDSLIESSDLYRVIARAGSIRDLGPQGHWQNNINGVNGADLSPGEFTFSSARTSTGVPTPATIPLIALGLAVLGFSRRKGQAS